MYMRSGGVYGDIERQHKAGGATSRDRLLTTLGTFSGECFIGSSDGTCVSLDAVWSALFDEKNAVLPFAKIVEQREDDSNDSVLNVASITSILFRFGAIAVHQTMRRPQCAGR